MEYSIWYKFVKERNTLELIAWGKEGIILWIENSSILNPKGVI